MSGYDWHPLAWELARRATISSIDGAVYAALALADNTNVMGSGRTSNAACHDLARKLTLWAGR